MMAILTSVNDGNTWDISSRSAYETMFGLKDANDWVGSDYDYEHLAKRVAEGQQMPKIFMGCGIDDALITANREYRDLLISLGYDVAWVEVEGAHSYYTSDAVMEKAMEWLPLESGLHKNYPYYGPKANVSIDNFNNWKTICNYEADMNNNK